MKNFKTKSIRNLLSLTTLLSLAACSGEYQRTVNEAAIEAKLVPTPIERTSLEQADDARLQAVNLDNLYALASRGDEASLLSVLDQTAPFILNPNYVEDRYSKMTKLQQVLTIFNRSLVQLNHLKSKGLVERKTNEHYLHLVLHGCDANLKGCYNYEFFRSDYQSSRILVQAAQALSPDLDARKKRIAALDTTRPETAAIRSAEDRAYLSEVGNYYRFLHMALDMRNVQRDAELDSLYLSHATDYAAYFQSLNSAESTAIDVRQHSEIFDLILTDFTSRAHDPAQRETFRSVIQNFSPWSFSQQNRGLFGNSASVILGLAAELCNQPDMQASCSFDQAIRDSQSATLADHLQQGEPFMASLNRLKSEHEKLVTSFNINTNIPQNPTFYIIDRIYHDHWSVDDASKVWRTVVSSGSVESQKDREEALLKILTDYIKIEILKQIVKTNETMSKIYATKAADTLFEQSRQESDVVAVQWRQILSRISALQIFVQRNLKHSTAADNAPSYAKTDQAFTSIQRNIKYLAIHPHMTLMTYYMAKHDFSISTQGGPVSASDIVKDLYELPTYLGPLWFNFESEDQVPLQRMETLWSFFYALKTETLTSVQVDHAEAVDGAKFFKVMIQKYLDSNMQSLRKDLRQFQEKMDQSKVRTAVDGICAEFSAPGHGGISAPLHTSLSIPLEDLSEYTFLGFETPNSGAEDELIYKRDLLMSLSDLRVTLSKRLTFVRTMIEIYGQHLAATGSSSDDVTASLSSIRDNLKDIEDMKTSYYALVMKRHQALTGCVLSLLDREREQEFQLMQKEVEFLKGVHRDMTRIRALDTAQQPAALVKLNQDLNSRALGRPAESGEDFDQVTGDQFRYAKLNLLLRLSTSLHEVAPNIDIILPPDLKNSPLYLAGKSSANRLDVNYDADVNVFVQRAMRAFNHGNGSMIKWASHTIKANVPMLRIQLMLELYRGGQAVSADDVVKAAIETANAVSLTDRDRQMMSWSGETEKFQVSGDASSDLALADFFLERGTERSISLMEPFYALLTDPDNSLLAESKQLYDAKVGMGYLLFAPDDFTHSPGAPEFVSLLQRQYKTYVKDYFKQVEDLESAIKKSEASLPKDFSIAYRLTDAKTGRQDVWRSAPAGQSSILLDPMKTRDFDNFRTKFTNDTQNFFESKKATVKAAP